MSFLFIDRIIRLEMNKQIIALKNVTFSEEVFRDHFVGCPIMPGSLLIECLAQAASALLEISDGLRHKALPVMLEQVKFRALVRPGDQLKVTINVVAFDQAVAQLDGTIHVADRLVVTARLVFALKDADEFYPVQARSWIETTYQNWLKAAEIVGVPQPPG